MSNLNQNIITADGGDTPADSPSTGSMLITMFLLIVGLLLTSTIMLNSSGVDLNNIAASESRTLPHFSEMTKKLFESDTGATAEQNAQKSELKDGLYKFIAKQKEKVRWPKLTLLGFGSSADGGGDFAIINGKQVHLNQLINGKVRLAEIRDHDVLVEYKGETKILTVEVALQKN